MYMCVCVRFGASDSQAVGSPRLLFITDTHTHTHTRWYYFSLLDRRQKSKNVQGMLFVDFLGTWSSVNCLQWYVSRLMNVVGMNFIFGNELSKINKYTLHCWHLCLLKAVLIKRWWCHCLPNKDKHVSLGSAWMEKDLFVYRRAAWEHTDLI